jgi:hypothetical protein
MTKTRRRGRGSATRGWKQQKPGYHQKTVMLRKCGRKCFLGPGKSYPICTKNTCKINPKGVYSAFIRSRQFHRNNISRKANKLLKEIGAKR